MFWNKYPYTDFSQINLDWLIKHIGGVLKELADSAGFLPKIRAGDENKVLFVKNGRPVWAESAGTGSALSVAVKMIDESDPFSALVLDKTWKEIKTAIDNNIPIIIDDSYRAGNQNYYYRCFGILTTVSEYPDNEQPYQLSILLNAEGSFNEWYFAAYNIDGYPDTTGSG